MCSHRKGFSIQAESEISRQFFDWIVLGSAAISLSVGPFTSHSAQSAHSIVAAKIQKVCMCHTMCVRVCVCLTDGTDDLFVRRRESVVARECVKL